MYNVQQTWLRYAEFFYNNDSWLTDRNVEMKTTH